MFVYDTLTFRPSGLPMVEVQDILDSMGGLPISPQSEALLQHYSDDGSVIPYVDKDIIKNWLKRGREAYTRAHDGRRPSWKYLIYLEYGPKYSRPHFHVLFGISPRLIISASLESLGIVYMVLLSHRISTGIAPRRIGSALLAISPSIVLRVSSSPLG